MVVAQLAGAGRALPSALKLPKIEMLERRPELEFAPVERAPEAPFLPRQTPAIDRHYNRSTAGRNADGTPQLYHTLLPDQKDPEKRILRFSAMQLAGYAADPYDPCRPFSLAVPFSVAICPTLASYAAARCGW
jgi:hypothetical protein